MGDNTRNVMRCRECRLNQYETRSGQCRRCGVSLVEPSAPEPEIPATMAQMIGKKIATYRRKRHLKQSELAKLAGLGRNTLNRAETGTIAPTVNTLTRIALALGIDVAELLPNQDQQPRSDGEDLFDGLAEKIRHMQESDRYMLLSAIKSLNRGQSFMTDTITV